MGVTPAYGLPYPEDTDVADVPTDMQELATAVEAGLNSKPSEARVTQLIDAKVQVGTIGQRPGSATEGTVYLVVP